ncbi:hypothetical protein [Desulfonatronospira sp.]|uniref:hypothetical protein n=1 Tax=Desulfonatronospira sp. TaxID=1962951 RepID=UPI0025BE0B26|nr:hypothetical protein [Desulfonatronospira sp.]
MNRPTPREILNKLQKARETLQDKRLFLIDQDTIAEHAIELEYDIDHDLHQVLQELLSLASMGDYAGSRPPQKSYKGDIKDLEIFPFIVYSTRFGCRVYFKFTISLDGLWLISLHKERRPGKD